MNTIPIFSHSIAELCWWILFQSYPIVLQSCVGGYYSNLLPFSVKCKLHTFLFPSPPYLIFFALIFLELFVCRAYHYSLYPPEKSWLMFCMMYIMFVWLLNVKYPSFNPFFNAFILSSLHSFFHPFIHSTHTNFIFLILISLQQNVVNLNNWN